jgi:hypothetical protein
MPQGGWTGDAWLSSVRGLSCSLKWGNERNPYCLLQVSDKTAQHRGHEREIFREFCAGRKAGMTPSQHVPLMPRATHVIQWMVQREATG